MKHILLLLLVSCALSSCQGVSYSAGKSHTLTLKPVKGISFKFKL